MPVTSQYHPIVALVVFQEKMILVVWCPGGQTRPYQAPNTLGKNAAYSYFIRRNSTTVKAQTKDIQRMIKEGALKYLFPEDKDSPN